MDTICIDAPKSGVDTYFIAGDWHYNEMDRNTFNMLLEMGSYYKGSASLIINGDFLDTDYFFAKGSGYQTWINRKDGVDEYFHPEYLKEIAWGNDILDGVQSIFKKVIYLKGNHEERIDRQLNCIPHHSRHLFDLKRDLNLASRGIDFIDYNNWLDIGPNLSITHGIYCGTTALKKHYEASGGRSVIYSHVHSHELKAFPNRGKTHQVWSLPCMSTQNPDYLRKSPNNWSLGFGQFHMLPDGLFNFYCYQNWNGKIILPSGKVIKG